MALGGSGPRGAVMVLAAAAAAAVAAAVLAGPAAANPREGRQQDTACRQGERSACLVLGRRYAEPYSPHEDRPRALALLRPLCDTARTPAEAAEACALVGDLLLLEHTLDPAGPGAGPAAAYLARACDAGSLATCEAFAAELESGELIPPDPNRARDLRERLCRSGRQASCAMLAPPQETAAADEDAPIMVGINRGVPAAPGSADWVAMLWRPEQGKDGPIPLSARLLCGGSMIAPGWVLTAAHCLDDSIGKVSPTSGHRIRLGAYDPLDETQGLTYPITAVIAHPQFKGREADRTLAFDIALVRYAERPLSRGKVRGKIAPVPLDTLSPEQRAIPGAMQARVMGWGRTVPARMAATRSLMQGAVVLLDRAACTAATAFRDHRRDSVLCAQEGIGQHNCQGDSGGPLVLVNEARRENVLVGVISGANKCGTGNRPSRFVRVTQKAVRAWLQSNLPADVWRRISAPAR